MATIDKITDRVAKLLAIAEHANTPPAEAEIALMQAQSLMTKHAIDEALVRQAQTIGERRALVRQDIEIGGGYTFRAYLRTILHYNAEANRVSVADHGAQAALFGTDEDVRWVITLHNMIRLQFLSKLDPKWDGALNYDANVYAMKVAGFKWSDIEKAAVKAGHAKRESTNLVHVINVDLSDEDFGSLRRWTERVEYSDWRVIVETGGEHQVREYNGFFHKLKAAYVRYAKMIGDDTRVKTQSHQAYRLSFVDAFRAQMADRFQRMIDDAKSSMDTIPGAALALRDLKGEADEMMWAAFPDLSPEEIAKLIAAERARREREARERQEMLDNMTAKQREAFLEKEERDARKRARATDKWYRDHTVYRDDQAYARGTAAANSVVLDRNAGAAETMARQEVGS